MDTRAQPNSAPPIVRIDDRNGMRYFMKSVQTLLPHNNKITFQKKVPKISNGRQLVSKQKEEKLREGKKSVGGAKEREREERRTVERGPFWMSSVSLATGPRPSKAPWAHGLFERSPLFSAASFITVTT